MRSTEARLPWLLGVALVAHGRPSSLLFPTERLDIHSLHFSLHDVSDKSLGPAPKYKSVIGNVVHEQRYIKFINGMSDIIIYTM
jgi:hypothetical protein